MHQLTDNERTMFDAIARSRPDLIEFLNSWRQAELERMAVSSETQFGALKGRVGVLTELQQLFSLSKP